MAGSPQRDGEPLSQVLVADLCRCKQTARLHSNPLGKACYELKLADVQERLSDLRRNSLLQAGLAFASEVWAVDGQPLGTRERRQFQAEIGCPPICLASLACAIELGRIRQEAGIRGDASASSEEKELQASAAEVAGLLVESGARIDAPDVGPHGDTALHIAARCGAPQLLSALLRLGASVAARNGEGSTAEVLAARGGHTTCEQILQVAAMQLVEKQDTVLRQIQSEEDSPHRRELKEAQLPRRSQLAPSHPGRSPGAGDEETSATADGEKATGGDHEHSGARAAYSKHGVWSALLEDHLPDDWQDDLDLPDEWDVDRWGEYRDWGEDWDAEVSDSDSGSEALLLEEDEEEVRAEVLRLQKEKAQQLQRLFDMAAEREERAHEAERVERQAAQMEQRIRQLEERQVRLQAGDPAAADDTAAEAEVSAWWEERATAHARAVWELERDLARQRKEQEEELKALEAQVGSLRRRTQGLEEEWDHFFEAQAAAELLECIASEQRSLQLADELGELVGLLDVPAGLKARLPPLVLDADGRVALPATPAALAAALAHRRLQAKRQEHGEQFHELVEFCNKQLGVKDEEILAGVEQEITHCIFPEMEVDDEREGWSQLREVVAGARQALEMSRPPAGSAAAEGRPRRPLPVAPASAAAGRLQRGTAGQHAAA